MSIRSSVGTVRGCLGHFLAMSLPNALPCWDVEAAGGVRCSVGTRSRVLGPLLTMSLPNFLQCRAS